MANTTSIQNKKILIAAPGSIYSTYDVYRYYLDAFRKLYGRENAIGFSYHNLIEYHRLAREKIYETTGFGMPQGEVELLIVAARELLIDVLLEKPDFVLFVDGSKYPVPIYNELRKLRNETNRNFIIGCYITESPYIDGLLDKFRDQFDILFVNDKLGKERIDPADTKHVYYLPHSYDSENHYPGNVNEKYQTDVFFCGTIYPERARFLRNINWSGINARICGAWSLVEPDVLQQLIDMNVASEQGLQNEEVAEYYRGCKIALNFNRTFGWDERLKTIDIEPDTAYSVGPRVIEAAACGAFILSEPRPELTEIFGDSIPTFTGVDELEEKIRYYLAHDEERLRLANESHRRVAEMSYDHRARYVDNALTSAINSFLRKKNNG